jgi:hypothetical protein
MAHACELATRAAICAPVLATASMLFSRSRAQAGRRARASQLACSLLQRLRYPTANFVVSISMFAARHLIHRAAVHCHHHHLHPRRRHHHRRSSYPRRRPVQISWRAGVSSIHHPPALSVSHSSAKEVAAPLGLRANRPALTHVAILDTGFSRRNSPCLRVLDMRRALACGLAPPDLTCTAYAVLFHRPKSDSIGTYFRKAVCHSAASACSPVLAARSSRCRLTAAGRRSARLTALSAHAMRSLYLGARFSVRIRTGPWWLWWMKLLRRAAGNRTPRNEAWHALI